MGFIFVEEDLTLEKNEAKREPIKMTELLMEAFVVTCARFKLKCIALHVHNCA